MKFIRTIATLALLALTGQISPLPGSGPVMLAAGLPACDAVVEVTQSSGTRILDFADGAGNYTLTCNPGGIVNDLVVGAGAGGGSAQGGGGGGGQVLTGSITLPPGNTTVTIGTGALADHSGTSTSIGSITSATGGGSGGKSGSTAGAQGGSGGGGAAPSGAGGPSNGTATNVGGTASANCPGGGGGASVAGTNGSTTSGGGGAGIASSLSGVSVVYGSGGGGGSSASGCGAGTGGSGAGNGNASGTGHPAPGNATGAGGGGGSTGGGGGGDGHVVISYPTNSKIANQQTLGAAGGNSSAGSFTLTTTNAISTGDLVFACVFTGGTAGTTISSLSDGTNTYTQAGGYVTTDVAGDILSLWYVANAHSVSSGAALKATFSVNNTSYAIAAMHGAGIQTSSPLDVTANATGSFTSAIAGSLTGPTITASSLNELFAGCSWTISPSVTVAGFSGSSFHDPIASVLFNTGGSPSMGIGIDAYIAGGAISRSYNPSWFWNSTAGTKTITGFAAAFHGQ